MNAKPKYLFDGPHWEIKPVRTFDLFFDALPSLCPEGAVLCLADGSWDEELNSFFRRRECPTPHAPNLPEEFSNGRHVPVASAVMEELTQIADHHAEPEIATHLAVIHDRASLLEWFDAPGDPMYLSTNIEASAIERFCEKLGTACERRK